MSYFNSSFLNEFDSFEVEAENDYTFEFEAENDYTFEMDQDNDKYFEFSQQVDYFEHQITPEDLLDLKRMNIEAACNSQNTNKACSDDSLLQPQSEFNFNANSSPSFTPNSLQLLEPLAKFIPNNPMVTQAINFVANPVNNAGANYVGFDNVGANNVGFDNVGANNVGFDNVGANNVGFDNAGANNVGFDNAGANNVGFDNVGANYVGFDNAGANNVGFNNAGANNVGANYVGFNNVGANNVGFNNVGANYVGFNNSGTNNVGANYVGFNNAGANNVGSMAVHNYSCDCRHSTIKTAVQKSISSQKHCPRKETYGKGPESARMRNNPDIGKESESKDWESTKRLEEKFGEIPKMSVLLNLGRQLEEKAKVKFTRDASRRRIVCLAWFNNNWDALSIFFDDVANNILQL